MLERHGVWTRRLHSERPGYIVYEDEFQVVATYTETDAALIAAGQRVRLTFDAVPDLDVTGSVQGLERPLVIIDMGTGLPLNDQDRNAEARAVAKKGVRSHRQG